LHQFHPSFLSFQFVRSGSANADVHAPHPLPPILIFRTRSQFSSFACFFWKRKGNGCYAGQDTQRKPRRPMTSNGSTLAKCPPKNTGLLLSEIFKDPPIVAYKRGGSFKIYSFEQNFQRGYYTWGGVVCACHPIVITVHGRRQRECQ